jgi:hypothetical protein
MCTSYKALFEMPKDRAEFISRLFSRKRPKPRENRVRSRFSDAFSAVEPGDLSESNLKDVVDYLKVARVRAFRRRSGWHSVGIEQLLPVRPSITTQLFNGAPAIVGASTFGAGRGGPGHLCGFDDSADDGNGQYQLSRQ